MKFAEVVFRIPIHRSFFYRVPENLQDKAMVGSRVKVPFGRRYTNGFIIDLLDEVAMESKQIVEVIDQEPPLNLELIKLGRWVSEYYLCSLGEALNCIFPLKLKSWQLEKVESKVDDFEKKYESLSILHLTFDERLKRYAEIIDSSPGKFIAIFPEIELAKEAFQKFKKILKKKVELYHSKISPKHRYQTWYFSKWGLIDVVVGTRSAVFLPMKGLAGIIVDEESELLPYKEERKPNYDLTTLALKRAKENCAKFISGNIVPTINTYYEIKMKNISRLDEEKKGKVRGVGYDVQIVDLHKEKSIFSDVLKFEINYRLIKNEQMLLYFNRRGFSPSVMCRRCGGVFKCPKCEVSLVYYKGENLLRCKYCAHQEYFSGVCKRCGISNFRFMGSGIEKVQSELRSIFPQAKVCLLSERLSQISEEIIKGDFDIILSTQLIHSYKGILNFARLSLIAIIDIDAFLYFPDYRSTERTFYSLVDIITYFSSMSDSKKLKKTVIIQTHTPNHTLFKAIKEFNYEVFYLRELMLRKRFFYPPFSELVNIVLSGKSHEKSLKEGHNLRDYLSRLSVEGVRHYGPFSPRAPRKTHQMLLKVPREKMFAISEHMRKYQKLFPSIKISFDVNPIQL